MQLGTRVAKLEAVRSGHGVVTICIRDSETRDEGFARHLAEGGADPADAELVVIIDDGI